MPALVVAMAGKPTCSRMRAEPASQALGSTKPGPVCRASKRAALSIAQLTSVILAEIPIAASGQASGPQSTFRQLGSALGVAILGTLLIGSLGRSTTTHLDAAGIPPLASQQVVDAVTGSAGTVIPTLKAHPATATAGDAAAAGMIAASKVTTGVAAIIIGLGLAATWALPNIPPTTAPAQTGTNSDSATSPRRRRGRDDITPQEA